MEGAQKLHASMEIITSMQVVISIFFVTVPDHDGGRPMEVNACILITHMVYL
jgi:hypothetical protein